MKKSKIRSTRITSPYETKTRKTERAAVAILMHWMREIIEDKNLDLGLPDVETIGDDKKLPDVVIYESRKSQNILCVIEVKRPYFDVFDEKELKKPAWEKANQRKAKYFAVTNFKELIWFNTERVNAQKPEEEQVVDKYYLSELENINQIEEPRYASSIRREIEKFLTKLYVVYTGKESEPKQVMDSWLVYRLQREIKTLSLYYRRIIYDQYHKDTGFRLDLKKWFMEQRWTFVEQDSDFNKVARQAAYLLVNKILFYDVLQRKQPSELDPLDIPESRTKSSLLQGELQNYFDEVLKIDYETIYTTDFIDKLAFLDSKEVVKEIRGIINFLKQYDFSTLGYDIIGKVFESLIPTDERHTLGQYFTNPDVVDIILRFCLTHEKDKIFDPACGAGTFLVRAYQHKKLMNQYLKHEEILDTLWGNDIAKFPAHLATINLVICDRDLSSKRNYPNIIQEDFFSLLSQQEGFELPDKWRKKRAKTLDLQEREIEYPRWFNAIVGNPPYTRQEEIPEIASENATYKKELIKKALLNLNGEKIAEISEKAGIHCYFFVHGTKFLQNGGRFGFIVNNSWLNSAWGNNLQKFFLKHYKIVTIIDSMIERWFEDAAVNTSIIILQKCNNKKERDENLVRFVYLKKPLSHFIPPAKDIWEEEKGRLNKIDDFIKTIEFPTTFYENDNLRIRPIKQQDLGNFSKWETFLRADEWFLSKMKECEGKLCYLSDVTKYSYGIKTGKIKFFYLDDERIKSYGVEKRYMRDIITTSKELKTIDVYPDKKIFFCHQSEQKLKGTGALKYIQYGKRRNMDKGRTVESNRPYWYSIDGEEIDFVLLQFWDKKFLTSVAKDRMFATNNFFYGHCKSEKDADLIKAQLNSILYFLQVELFGRIQGEGVLNIYGPELDVIKVIGPRSLANKRKDILSAFTSMRKREIASIFEELGLPEPDKEFSNIHPEEVSLEKVKQDRLKLDLSIFTALGLSDNDILNAYKLLVNMVKWRLKKAKSFGNKRKTKGGIDIDLLTKTVMNKIGDETLGKFYKEKILSQKHLYTKSLSEYSDKIKIEKGIFGWRLYSGRKYIDCQSESEARYLKVWLCAGLEKVKVPKDENYLESIVTELEKLKKEIDEIVNGYLSSILDTKISSKISYQLWMEITQ